MKMWLILLLVPVSAVYAESAGAAGPRRITLEEALRLAEEAPVAAVLDREADLARAEVRGAGLWPNPDLLFSREEAAGTEDRFANITVPLPLSGRLSLERSAAQSGLRAAVARTRQARVSLLRAGVREAFVDLLAAQERSSALAEGLSRLSELVEVLRAREREGESSGFDLIRSDRERAEVESDHLESLGREARPRGALAALLGLPSEGLVAEDSLDARGALPGQEEVRTLVASRGDLTALDAEAEKADYLARAAGRRAIPEPALTIGAKTTEAAGTSDTGSVAAISFTLPIFDRGQGGRGIARAEGAVLRARRAVLARQAQAEAEAALSEATARRGAAEAYAAAGDPEELTRIARAAYGAGEMRILELLDAYRTVLSVHLRMIDLRAGARRSEIELYRVLGTEVVR